VSKAIESTTSEELSNDELASIQGGEQLQHGTPDGRPKLPDYIEFPFPIVPGPVVIPSGPVGPKLEPKAPDRNDPRTLIFF
jgi:bacteriocin-like protein